MNHGSLKISENIIAKQFIRTLTVFAGALAILLTTGMGFISYYIETKNFRTQFGEIEKSYADVLRTALWIDDKETITTVLIGICSLPRIQYADIHFNTDTVCKSGKKSESEEWVRSFPIVHVYKGEAIQLGVLHVQGDVGFLHKKLISTILVIGFAQATTILIICCLLLWLMHGKVISRVMKITSYTSTLSLETLSKPLVMPSRKEVPDELDSLAHGINQMRQNLHQAYIREKEVEVQLKRSHDSLEEQVGERTRALNETVHELQAALSEVKTISGLLPICSHCKKIRDDKGYWNNLEVYIENHSEAFFSHGMCSECSDKLYGNEGWYIKMKHKKETK